MLKAAGVEGEEASLIASGDTGINVGGGFDLAEDFAALARMLSSRMSFRLFTGQRVLGALNLYSGDPGAFADGMLVARWAKVYAAHAALALGGATTQADLRAALESRETISVAIRPLDGPAAGEPPRGVRHVAPGVAADKPQASGRSRQGGRREPTVL